MYFLVLKSIESFVYGKKKRGERVSQQTQPHNQRVTIKHLYILYIVYINISYVSKILKIRIKFLIINS